MLYPLQIQPKYWIEYTKLAFKIQEIPNHFPTHVAFINIKVVEIKNIVFFGSAGVEMVGVKDGV